MLGHVASRKSATLGLLAAGAMVLPLAVIAGLGLDDDRPEVRDIAPQGVARHPGQRSSR